MKNGKSVAFFYPNIEKASTLKMFQDLTSQVRGFYFTKDNIKEVEKLEFSSNYAVYFLFNNSDSLENQSVYIGQSSNGIRRITDHKKLKDFWSYCIMFVTDNNSFDKLTIDYLEYYFIHKFKKSSLILENKDERSQKPNVNIFDYPKLNSLTEQIEFLLESNNIIFEMQDNMEKQIKYYKAIRNHDAKIFVKDGKFVLVEGSEIKRPIESSKEWKNDNFYNRYNSLIDSFISDDKVVKKDDKLLLTVNISFNSPTMPAALCCGYSVNGWNFFEGLDKLRNKNISG